MEKTNYRILTIFDFDESGADVSGIEINVNADEMNKQFADVESMLDYADRCCDNYNENEDGDEVRLYDEGHNIDTLIGFLVDRGLITDYKKEFSFTYNGNIEGGIYFRKCDLTLKFN